MLSTYLSTITSLSTSLHDTTARLNLNFKHLLDYGNYLSTIQPNDYAQKVQFLHEMEAAYQKPIDGINRYTMEV
jgi:hypothetical protein